MKKGIRTWRALAVLGLAICSCKQQTDVPPSSGSTENGQSHNNAQMTQLIRQLENPYSVANMQKALNNLQKSNARVATDGLDVTTTHLYIKFKPQNNKELEILKDDSSLVLYSYPMDYEISEGSYYHDPSIPDSLPTYQYCAVPADKKLPQGVAYEVLENLYIPDEYKDGENTNQRRASDEVVTALVDEALRITGNLTPSPKNARVAARSWRPAGRVRVLDDATNTWRGVEGVIVKARRWFTTHEGMVDANGNYSCNGTFKRDANYSLDWERYDFALREGWLDGANINGPKREGNWDNDFQGAHDRNAFHAKVFIAAYHYYYKDIRGLRRPPQNGFWRTQLRIRCHNEHSTENNGYYQSWNRLWGLGNPVHIYNQQKTPNRTDITTREIYATTIHELAHASHWNMSSGGDYSNCEEKVAESWARGVQWELTRMVWGNYRGGPRIAPNYTQVVVDMIDGTNDDNNGEENLTNDNVTGYNIREIEDALQGQRTWDGWKDNIKNRYNNGTENNLDALFQYWNTFTN